MSLQEDKEAMNYLTKEFNAQPHYTEKQITGIEFLTKITQVPGKIIKQRTVFNTGSASCGFPLLPKWGDGLAVKVLNYLRKDPNRSPSPKPFLQSEKN